MCWRSKTPAISAFRALGPGGGALGPGGDGKVPGLFLHPVIALDAADGTALGLAGGRVWTRAPGKVVARRSRALADRESARWIASGEAAKAALAGAKHVTLIADRESDIYEEWVSLPSASFDLITRACQDRLLEDKKRLFTVAAGWPAAGRRTIKLPARNGRPKRIAKLALRFGAVVVCRPGNCTTPGLPETVRLNLVEVVEIDPPADQEPIHWRLLTTHAVASKKAASKKAAWRIVGWYRMRWRIEEYFRVLKRSGLESAKVEGGHALLNLIAMAAVAGVAVMQLVEGRDAGRDAGPERRATEVIAQRRLPG